jgi:hypothetical protein
MTKTNAITEATAPSLNFSLCFGVGDLLSFLFSRKDVYPVKFPSELEKLVLGYYHKSKPFIFHTFFSSF